MAVLSRRNFLIGCSAAAAPLFTPVTFAAAPGENRLVVIVLRGAMDGLDLLRPLGDPALMALRPRLTRHALRDPLDLDGFFALHPACADLMPLWQAGELSFATAVATPYRSRSHFTGQDFLENGGDAPGGNLTASADGWLNRAIQLMPGTRAEMAVAIGQEPMLILEGKAPARHWLPVADSALSAQGLDLLGDLYAGDPAFAAAYAEALALRDETEAADPKEKKDMLGQYVAGRLNAEARIAAFSFSGWDTHHNQEAAISRRLMALTSLFLTLKDELGANWDRTAILALTEFGRTAAENGTAGTDHGTGGAAILAGGAVRGGKIHGNWPGLDEASLLDRRDLMPTEDVRGHAASLLHAMFGLRLSDLAATVFPALDLTTPYGLVR